MKGEDVPWGSEIRAGGFSSSELNAALVEGV